MTMEFTGERYVPQLRGQIYYEHVHRYAIAARFAAGKRVLDIASGEGYGSALLAYTAESVLGVDIDEGAIEQARRRYYAANLRFMRGSVTEIPLGDASVDLIASFETIEHVGEHDKMLAELRRVLVPGGVVLLSSPNKLVYSDNARYDNPFHVKELYFSELRDLLTRRFRHVVIYGQRVTASSLVHPLAGRVSDEADWYNGAAPFSRGLPTLRSPVYFMAVCSDEQPTIDISSAYIDPADDLLVDMFENLGGLRVSTASSIPPGEAMSALPVGTEPGTTAAGPPPEAEDHARDAELAELRAQHEAELAELRAQHEAQTAELHAQHEAQSAQRRADDDAAVAQVRAEYDAHVAALVAQHAAQTAELHAQLEAQSAPLRAQLEAETALRLQVEAERGEVQVRLAECVGSINALERELTGAHIQLRRAQEASLAAATELAEERGRTNAMSQQIAELRAAHAAAERECSAALEAAHRARDEIDAALRAEIAALGKALADSGRDSALLREVLSSHSWKLTMPLRRAVKLVRR